MITLRNVIGPLLLTAIFTSCINTEMTAPPELKPYPAPEFELTDLSGKTVKLSDYRGKAVLINFWATWCLPCVNEIPFIEETYRDRKKDGFEVLLVNVKEPEEPVRKFAGKHSITSGILLDPDGRVNRLYEVFALPSSYFVDKEGIVRYVYMGELTKGVMKMGIKTVMGNNP